MDEEDNAFWGGGSTLFVSASGGVVTSNRDIFVTWDPDPLFLGTLRTNSSPRDTTPTKEIVDEYMKLFIEE